MIILELECTYEQKERKRELHRTTGRAEVESGGRTYPVELSSPGATVWEKHLILPPLPWGFCSPPSPDTLPASLVPLWDILS